jgi:hypothetical protein
MILDQIAFSPLEIAETEYKAIARDSKNLTKSVDDIAKSSISRLELLRNIAYNKYFKH